MAAAHAKRLTHRDLKPSNVMLTETGAKLLDFGLAKVRAGARLHEAAGALTDTNIGLSDMLMGTLQYMSPEQIERRAVDHRTDIFAFGAVLHEMMTGRRVFAGQSRADIIALILKGDVPALRAGRAHVPPALSSLVKTCLEKDPAHRWQSLRQARAPTCGSGHAVCFRSLLRCKEIH